MKRQVLANLANFAYDPLNFEYLCRLEVPELLIENLSNRDSRLVEFAIGGLCNIVNYGPARSRLLDTGIEDVMNCLHSQNDETVISALTTLVFILNDDYLSDTKSEELSMIAQHLLATSANFRVKNLAQLLLTDCLIPGGGDGRMALGNAIDCTSLLRRPGVVFSFVRNIVRIPLWEYHIRFDSKVGKKIPCADVLNRFKRLNNGMWIRAHPGRYKFRYVRDEPWLTKSMYHETIDPIEQQILDKLVNRFWLRPKYYVNDPYAPYHVRHGLKEPRVGDDGKFLRERPKILLDDYTAQKYFYDR